MNKKIRFFIMLTAFAILFSFCLSSCSCQEYKSSSESVARSHKANNNNLPQQAQDLNRFLKAQTPELLQIVKEELSLGKKQSHWIWYIFPQMKGLGLSENSTFYGIKSLSESKEYLKHSILRVRLLEHTSLVLTHVGKKSLLEVFEVSGQIDVDKFISSMTLFLITAYEIQDKEAGQIFANALSYFKHNPDTKTLNILGVSKNNFNSMIHWSQS